MPHIDLPQGTVHYRDEGPRDAPVVVFLHGLLVDGRLWRKVVPLLSADHRVVVPDLPLGAHCLPLAPGADRTPAGVARLVADLLEALDLTDVTLFGTDTGGGIAQLVTANHPERLGRLVLASCDAFEHFPPPLLRPLLSLAARDRLLRLSVAGMRWKRTWPVVFGLVAKRPIDPVLVRSWVDQVLDDPATFHDMAAFLRAMRPAVTLEAARRLPAFRRPVLVLWAREDRIFPPRDAERLVALFDDARLVWVEDSYAFVSEDQPGVTAGAVRDFVAQTPTGSAAAGMAPAGT